MYQDLNEQLLLAYVPLDKSLPSTDFFVDLFVLLTDDIHRSDIVTFVRPFRVGIYDRSMD